MNQNSQLTVGAGNGALLRPVSGVFDIEMDGGFAVTIKEGVTDTEILTGLAKVCDMPDLFKGAAEGSKWIIGRALLAAEPRLGDTIYQSIPDKAEITTMKIVDTCREFTEDEVKERTNLHFTHFQEVRFTGDLTHDERLMLVDCANEQGLTAKATRALAKEFKIARDGARRPYKAQWAIVWGDGSPSVAEELTDIIRSEATCIIKLGPKPKFVVGFEVDGEPILDVVPDVNLAN